eukprot:jgi/Psemu1/30990/gm1.30990_g
MQMRSRYGEPGTKLKNAMWHSLGSEEGQTRDNRRFIVSLNLACVDREIGVKIQSSLNKPVKDSFPTVPACDPTLTKPGPSFQSEPGLTMYMKNKAPYSAVTTLTHHHQLKLSEGLDQKPAHTVAAVWGPLYTKRLLLLCGKQEEADLPPIYPAWAQKSKHEKTHMIFQSQVASRAYELGIQAPLVTTAVLKRFQDYSFHGTDPFDPPL